MAWARSLALVCSRPHSIRCPRPKRGGARRRRLRAPALPPVPESEAWAMAPPGVSIHASRMRWQRGDPRASAESPHVDSAAELLAYVKPRAIMYGYMSSSYVLGAAGDEAFRSRVEKAAAG